MLSLLYKLWFIFYGGRPRRKENSYQGENEEKFLQKNCCRIVNIRNLDAYNCFWFHLYFFSYKKIEIQRFHSCIYSQLGIQNSCHLIQSLGFLLLHRLGSHEWHAFIILRYLQSLKNLCSIRNCCYEVLQLGS